MHLKIKIVISEVEPSQANVTKSFLENKKARNRARTTGATIGAFDLCVTYT